MANKGSKKVVKKKATGKKKTDTKVSEKDISEFQEVVKEAAQDEDFEIKVVETKEPERKPGRFVAGEAIRRADDVFAASVNKATGGTLPITTYKGVPDDLKRLRREVKKQKVFTEKVLDHFKNTVVEKNILIDSLKEEIAVVRKRADILDAKLNKVEELMDKLLFDHFKNEDIANEDKFDQFVDDLQIVFS